MTTFITNVTTLVQQHPEIGVPVLYLCALVLHIVVGAALHLVRLHDFDWHRLGAFVEQDFAVVRGLAILTTFLLTLLTTTVPGADWRMAFGPAFAALLLATGAAILPIVRDTLYELIQLISGYDIRAEQATAAQVKAASTT